MDRLTISRAVLLLATLMFIAWTLVATVFWPVEDYGNLVHAYTESTNLVVRGMSIGVTWYLSVLGLIIGWNATKRQPS